MAEFTLISFDSLRDNLVKERENFIRAHSLEKDSENIRSEEKAKVVLDFLAQAQAMLTDFFGQNPSLLSIFNKDFGSFQSFIHRDSVLEICFIDDCLFPETDGYYFIENGNIVENVFEDYLQMFAEWCDDKKREHDTTQVFLAQKQDKQIKANQILCQCIKCISDFRSFVRDRLFDECHTLINKTRDLLDEFVPQGDLNKLNNIFYGMQKELEKKIFAARFDIKRGILGRLEKQVKNLVRDVFAPPSELAQKQIIQVRQFFMDHMKKQRLRTDLIDDTEFDRFFNMLSTNIWRNEIYLEREFSKLVKTVLMLKRKNISVNILKDYLAEFWSFSRARQLSRRIIYHMGPTNSGKTYHAVNRLCEVDTGCYLAPLRLLAAELFDTMNAKGVPTTLLTGEECIETEGARHYSSTIEMARFNEDFNCAVIDEIQMIADPQRGWAWTRALVNISAKEIHICGDHTALDLVKKIVHLCDDTLEIKTYERMTELKVETAPIRVGDLQKSDALIVFSRRNALKFKYDLERMGFKVSIVYGRLGPEVRREQARRFDVGDTDVIVSTDAISMGMNLPIKRIVFSTLSKFITNEEVRITKSEIMQISGRAGRYGRFPTGYISCLSREENGIAEIMEAMKYHLPQKEKCMVGPDLDIYQQVNDALNASNLPLLSLPEFLHLFNTMNFEKPFHCVDLKEMIELAEIVEEIDVKKVLNSAEKFGFSCAPVDMNLTDHVQYFVNILGRYVNNISNKFMPIDIKSADIDYLESSIKCVELYQWLSRHFNNKNFTYDLMELLHNKGLAIEQLNELLSDKIVPLCASCGLPLEENSRFSICEICFKSRRFVRTRRFSGAGQRTSSSENTQNNFKANNNYNRNSFKNSRKSKGNRSQKTRDKSYQRKKS